MSKPVIRVEGLSKQYRLGKIGTGTLTHDLNRWWHLVRGKEDPYLKIGEANDRSSRGESQYVWSLKDINFEIKQGEAVGIIGRNGAGKSTLLKILSRTTAPTLGSVKLKGRVASLLEVGTGFHPELSGRENIFLNGAILGMTKAEIRKKFDEIVDFAGVARYVDTPVKRYSSGMYVRLAFGVAAHLEPDILIVDEVLAVGDAEFQKKALGKMQDVSQGEGRTVLFVSHNMAAVKNLCSKGIVLSNGQLAVHSGVDDAISKYLSGNSFDVQHFFEISEKEKKNRDVWISFAQFEQEGDKVGSVICGEELTIRLGYESRVEGLRCKLFLGLYDENELKLLHLGTPFGASDFFISKRKGEIVCKIPRVQLVKGLYTINFSLHIDDLPYHRQKNALKLEVIEGDFFGTGKLPDIKESRFLVDQKWTIK